MPCPNCIKLEAQLDAAKAQTVLVRKTAVQERLADRFAASGANVIESEKLAEKHIDELDFQDSGSFGYRGLQSEQAIRRLVSDVNLGVQLPSQKMGARIARGELNSDDLKPGSKALADAIAHGQQPRYAEQLTKEIAASQRKAGIYPAI